MKRSTSASPIRGVTVEGDPIPGPVRRQSSSRYPQRHNIFTRHHQDLTEPKHDVQMDDVSQAFKEQLQFKEQILLSPRQEKHQEKKKLKKKTKKRVPVDDVPTPERETTTESEESEESSSSVSPSEETDLTEEDEEEEEDVGVIAEFLTKLWKKQEMCDLILKSGKYELLAHKIPLAAYSEQFAAQCIAEVPTGPCEVVLTDTTIEAVQEILKYIYLGELDIKPSNLDPVVSAARQLGVTEVIDSAKDFLMDFDHSTVLKYMWTAEKYEWLDVCSYLFDYVCRNILEISNEESFLKSPIDKVLRLLKEDNLNVKRELDIYFIASNWLDYNRQERMKHTQEMLNTVRFPLITPDEIVKHVEPNMQYYSEKCGVLLTNIFRFHALRYSGGASDGDLPKARHYRPVEYYDKKTGVGVVSAEDFDESAEDEEEAEEEESESTETESTEVEEEESESTETESTESESEETETSVD